MMSHKWMHNNSYWFHQLTGSTFMNKTHMFSQSYNAGADLVVIVLALLEILKVEDDVAILHL